MAKITCKEGCGNAPKQQFIKDFCVALANGELEAAINMVTDDVNVEIPGNASAKGKRETEELIRKDMERASVSELILENILSHGKYCATNGVLKFSDGGEVAFCNIYTFGSHSKNAKLKEIKTYSIVLTNKQ
jgi:limonene-1,2-epoxide hydrolase